MKFILTIKNNKSVVHDNVTKFIFINYLDEQICILDNHTPLITFLADKFQVIQILSNDVRFNFKINNNGVVVVDNNVIIVLV